VQRSKTTYGVRHLPPLSSEDEGDPDSMKATFILEEDEGAIVSFLLGFGVSAFALPLPFSLEPEGDMVVEKGF
jgi:hypothetical protein